MRRTTATPLALAAALVIWAGCALDAEEPPPPLGDEETPPGQDPPAHEPDEIEVEADNGIFLDNGLNLTPDTDVGNGIKLTNGFNLANGIDLANGIKLTNGVLRIEPPPGSDLERWIDADPTMRLRVIRYQVECALSPDIVVTVVYRDQVFAFPGQVALGPSWLDGLMTYSDQERVSACLLARVNARGDTLRIILVGPYPGLDSLSDDERARYPTREATFVGNAFSYPALFYVAGVEPCGSRACRANLETGTCDCGMLDDVTSCYSDGADYDTSCRFFMWRQFDNPITTYVDQQRPGGPCAADIDCIYHNCGPDSCGGPGAACGWDEMCATTTCGDDSTCTAP